MIVENVVMEIMVVIPSMTQIQYALVNVIQKKENFMSTQTNEIKNLHRKMRKKIPKPKFCEDCKINEPLDLANVSDTYQELESDWEWLCRKCHMTKDGRLYGLQNSCTKEVIQKAVRTRQQRYQNGELQKKGWKMKKLQNFKPTRDNKGRFVQKSDCHD